MAPRTRLTDHLRELICGKYNALKPIVKIAEELELNVKTVTAVIKIYKETGRIKSAIKKCGRKKKITPEQVDFIKNEINEEVSITLNTLKSKILEKFNVSLSKSTISNAIEAFHYSFKRVTLVPMARNTTENKAKRFQYACDFTQISHESFIFLDECGISCSLRRSYGRSLRGTSPRKTVRAIRSQNISISAAITQNGIYFFEYSFIAYNGEKYGLFIANLCEKLRSEGITNRCFVMDNVPFHKMIAIRELINSEGHSVLFLPPYSPQLNPIENLFSKWKGLIKDANCDTKEQLLDAIRSASSLITEEDCEGYFSNMLSFIGKAFADEDF